MTDPGLAHLRDWKLIPAYFGGLSDDLSITARYKIEMGDGHTGYCERRSLSMRHSRSARARGVWYAEAFGEKVGPCQTRKAALEALDSILRVKFATEVTR
jgi:hypothetical protein